MVYHLSYPNIQVISVEQNMAFFEREDPRPTERYDFLKTMLKLDEYEAAVVISPNLTNLNDLISYIVKKEFKKLYFFIDDVFRASIFINMAGTPLELLTIDEIIEKTQIKEFRLFHCEILSSSEFRYYKNTKLKYADLYLLEWSEKLSYLNLPFTNKFKYKVSCFNNRCSSHRLYISALLCKNKEVLTRINQINKLENLSNYNFNYLNFNIEIREKIINGVNYISHNKGRFSDSESNGGFIHSNLIQNKEEIYHLIVDSFLNLVTETSYFTNRIYVSEKSLKPIICRRPFIILGPPKTLQHLKNLGFKTFSKWWDESYDSIEDHHNRFIAVYNLTKFILDKNREELSLILKEMQPILDYNLFHFKTNFRKKLKPSLF